jgi:hypothetical protein
MKKYHPIENVRIENGILKLSIDGVLFEKPLHSVSSLLAHAQADALQVFDVSPSGYGIYWPLLDEDISIDGLLGIEHKPETKQQAA